MKYISCGFLFSSRVRTSPSYFRTRNDDWNSYDYIFGELEAIFG